MRLDAIVVLGCRVSATGELRDAAARRAQRAASAYAQGVAPLVIASGGKLWGGVAEAHAFSAELIRCGVPAAQILRETRSLSTLQNARFVAELARERRLVRLAVVTCDWHMRRALAAFHFFGASGLPFPAPAPAVAAPRRLWRGAREHAQFVFDQCLARLEGYA